MIGSRFLSSSCTYPAAYDVRYRYLSCFVFMTEFFIAIHESRLIWAAVVNLLLRNNVIFPHCFMNRAVSIH